MKYSDIVSCSCSYYFNTVKSTVAVCCVICHIDTLAQFILCFSAVKYILMSGY